MNNTRLILQNLVAHDVAQTFIKIGDYFETTCRAMRDQRGAKRHHSHNPADIGQAVARIHRALLHQYVPSLANRSYRADCPYRPPAFRLHHEARQ